MNSIIYDLKTWVHIVLINPDNPKGAPYISGVYSNREDALVAKERIIERAGFDSDEIYVLKQRVKGYLKMIISRDK